MKSKTKTPDPEKPAINEEQQAWLDGTSDLMEYLLEHPEIIPETSQYGSFGSDLTIQVRGPEIAVAQQKKQRSRHDVVVTERYFGPHKVVTQKLVQPLPDGKLYRES